MKKQALIILALICSMYTMAQQISYWDVITFEPSASYLYIDNSVNNLWQIGAPDKPVFNSAFSVPNVIVTDTINSYTPNNNSTFIVKLEHESFWEQQMTHFTFRHQFFTDTINDYGVVEVSYDCGNTWNILALDETYDMTYHRIPPSGIYTSQYLATGKSNGWCYDLFDWYWYFPVKSSTDPMWPDNIWIKFKFVSDGNTANKDGWMVDHITIYADYYAGLDEQKTSFYSNVYPNPCDDILSIDTPYEEEQNLMLYVTDVIGKLILKKECFTKTIQLNTSGMPDGIYTYLLVSKSLNSYSSGKFIVGR